ncbi:MAG: hypothetical protein J6M12_00770 [Clostridia bacterium]|nr:hypothetical protein [Clostridia bacterium]
MNKKEPRSFSERFDTKYVLLSLVWLIVLIVSITLMVLFIHHDIFGVFFAFTSVGALIMLVLSYKKAVLEGTVEEGMVLIFVALGKMFNFILLPAIKLLTKLGFLRGRYGNANDEHSFIFDFGEKASRLRVDKLPKWKNLTDNHQRVRFIFTKHINFRIKKGYRYNKTLTPSETEKELQKYLKEEEDISLLFDSYRLARYENPERTQFDDELIEKLRELY